MILILTTACLLFSGLCALDGDSSLKAQLELLKDTDPILSVLLEEIEMDESPALEKRQECKDKSILCSLMKARGYCRFGAIVDRCPETCDACEDPTCRDSFQYGCEEQWCSVDYIADLKCQRTCGTCHSTCQNSFKHGCKKEWCGYPNIPEQHCQKTCGTCTEGGEIPDNECPNGQMMCPIDNSCADVANFDEVCFGGL